MATANNSARPGKARSKGAGAGKNARAIGAVQAVLPAGWTRPSGYTHGLLAAPGARVLAIAGQVGVGQVEGEKTGRAAGEKTEQRSRRDFAVQFATALERVLAVVAAAGGDGAELLSLTIYVTSLAQYRASRSALREIWRTRLGQHYPAVTLVAVAGLLDEGALVEIAGTAAIPTKRVSTAKRATKKRAETSGKTGRK